MFIYKKLNKKLQLTRIEDECRKINICTCEVMKRAEKVFANFDKKSSILLIKFSNKNSINKDFDRSWPLQFDILNEIKECNFVFVSVKALTFLKSTKTIINWLFIQSFSNV